MAAGAIPAEEGETGEPESAMEKTYVLCTSSGCLSFACSFSTGKT